MVRPRVRRPTTATTSKGTDPKRHNLMVEVRNAPAGPKYRYQASPQDFCLVLYSLDCQIEFELAALSGKLFEPGDLDGRTHSPSIRGRRMRGEF